jgi:hypothetical protein
MDSLQKSFDYFDSFLCSKKGNVFGSMWAYPDLQSGKYQYDINITFSNGEEFSKKCDVDFNDEGDGWWLMDTDYKFSYQHGLVQEIITEKEDDANRVILTLLSLPCPLVIGNFCKEEKNPDTDKVYTVMFSVEQAENSAVKIDAHTTLSFDSDITHRLLTSNYVSKDGNIESIESYVDEEDFVATISLKLLQ